MFIVLVKEVDVALCALADFATAKVDKIPIDIAAIAILIALVVLKKGGFIVRLIGEVVVCILLAQCYKLLSCNTLHRFCV